MRTGCLTGCCRICERRSRDKSCGGRPRRTLLGASVWKRDLDRHPILGDRRLLEHLPCLLDELLGADRVARRDVRQHQAPSLGRERHLRRLARRRMPRLLGPILLLLPKRRLVNQQVRPLRRIHDARTGSRIPGEYDEPPGTAGAYEVGRLERWTVGKRHGLALGELSPQRTLGNPCGLGLLHIEAASALVLLQSVSDTTTSVLCSEHMDVVV